ncbi:YL1 nuclear protein-domain-containing protein [Xylaria bambusicola]|uniref:YL1 nuclear protein-domain-containing protein n=1 Tax=Xylaria bambusicola TaxID=326684 RepID=UPI00200849B3|nr:YL1 nuclear protein-domain-containing protein [Xylaria bambusicola]KAI0512686.1 YL1 nuclear protein-domain-containing protein [Xylaria bambusicola]
MATSDDEEERMRVDKEENDALSSDSSDSENGLSGDEDPPPKIEWLATGREKRSTAGNRMKSMIAAEEPDDELELLFAEDADDAGFTDVEDEGSDAHMSSSEDEDAQENADDLEGEKELEKQARESRQAARKRKAQEAIPLKFRKKVKIDTSQTPSASATPAPKPRPRKKSERISWLPSPADMPTRASKRETTMAGKEQLHKQMAEREVKRLQQIEAMERKAKRMEALKKPPMTQAERLAEAALVEKRNAKSLNRWEEAEKQREEERKAKLAALNNRTLEGPVVTFWSGVGEWVDGKLKHVGKIVTIEEKPTKKKRQSAVGVEETADSSHEDKPGQTDDMRPSPDRPTSNGHNPGLLKEANPKSKQVKSGEVSVSDHEGLAGAKTENVKSSTGVGQEAQPGHTVISEIASATPPIPHTATPIQEAPGALASRGQAVGPVETISQPQIPAPADIRPPDLKPPDLQPPNTGLYTTSMFAPPTQPSLMQPLDMKPPSNSFLAPPVGVSQTGLSMPMIGYQPSSSSTTSSNVLAPPNPTHRQSPLSMPQTNIHAPPVSTPNQPGVVTSTPIPSTSSTPSTTPAFPHARASKAPGSTMKSAKANAQKHSTKEAAPPPPPPPPANGKATRNCIILQNFNENAIKDKSVQTRILFGREMSKLPKHGPAPRCVITNHPAKYRDAKTGLPYYNAYAYKEIRKLYSGEYKWSSLIGAWVGSGKSAALGVPARFTDPDTPLPAREKAAPEPVTKNEEVTDTNKNMNCQAMGNKAEEVSTLSTSHLDKTVSSATEGEISKDTTAAVNEPGIEPGKAEAHFTNTQPCVPTTTATFAVGTDYTTSSDGPSTSNTQTGPLHNMDTVSPSDVTNTPSNPSGLPIPTVGLSPTRQAAPPSTTRP